MQQVCSDPLMVNDRPLVVVIGSNTACPNDFESAFASINKTFLEIFLHYLCPEQNIKNFPQ